MREKIVIWSAILLAWATIAFGASGIINTNNDVTLSNSIALIIKANPGRQSVCCQNTGGTNAARVGDANTSATQGFNLDPDLKGLSGICIVTSAAIYGYSTSGTTVGCNEVMNP